MDPKDFIEQIARLATLDVPLRRRLYRFVAEHGGDVTRDEAARATGVSRSLAAFHLDKLVEANFLEATFRRPSGRGGPGAGRPSKLYRRSAAQIDVSIPQRRYALAGQILVRALANAPSEESRRALRDAAREWGKRLAAEPALGAGRGRPLTRVARVLEACGFEPQGVTKAHGELTLRNCPFDSLRNEAREVTCAMNLALIEGLLEGLSLEDLRAELEPRPGMCCVAVRSRSNG
jgi:predicted ArsR family transcriptional regulator